MLITAAAMRPGLRALPALDALRNLSIPHSFWVAAVRSGAGAICSRIARGRLQILCYHGFSFIDEHRFRGKMFMTPECLSRRLDWLKRHRFTVLPLDEAIARLRSGRIREREIAITIDDGFRGVHALAAPIFAAHAFPATVYITSYYVTHANPVFRLAMQYIAWKSRAPKIELTGLLPGMHGSLVPRAGDAEVTMQRLYTRAESECDETARLALAESFAERAEVDFAELRRSGRFSLMRPEEIRDLSRFGIDVQLHTHRHRLPIERGEVVREINDNRAVLEPLAGRPLTHFCYPSGAWQPEHWAGLSQAGIESATTCMPGFNRFDEPALALRRFLDGEDLPEMEFAAEMLGVKDLMRRVLRRRAGRPGATQSLD